LTLDANARVRQNLRSGILLTVCGAAILGVMDGTGKYLTSSLSVGHILWARYFFHILIVFLVLSRSGSFEFLRTKKPGLQFVRAAAVFGATICMYSALSDVSAFTLEHCMWASDWPYLRATERQDVGPLVDLVERLFPDPDDLRVLLWETPRQLFGFGG